jgi:hypothetical protein
MMNKILMAIVVAVIGAAADALAKKAFGTK